MNTGVQMIDSGSSARLMTLVLAAELLDARRPPRDTSRAGRRAAGGLARDGVEHAPDERRLAVVVARLDIGQRLVRDPVVHSSRARRSISARTARWSCQARSSSSSGVKSLRQREAQLLSEQLRAQATLARSARRRTSLVEVRRGNARWLPSPPAPRPRARRPARGPHPPQPDPGLPRCRLDRGRRPRTAGRGPCRDAAARRAGPGSPVRASVAVGGASGSPSTRAANAAPRSLQGAYSRARMPEQAAAQRDTRPTADPRPRPAGSRHRSGASRSTPARMARSIRSSGDRVAPVERLGAARMSLVELQAGQPAGLGDVRPAGRPPGGSRRTRHGPASPRRSRRGRRAAISSNAVTGAGRGAAARAVEGS